MPETFAGYEVVARTKNFLVTCADDADARVRASNIAFTCEDDLARLNELFSTNFEAGKTSPYTIWVVVLKDDPTSQLNGWNYGYETDESSQIWISRGFVPPPPAPPSLIPPDPPPLSGPDLDDAIVEFPRFVFVAELAEILMQFTGYGWGPGQAPGEGLSNLLGALLHPTGYYDAGQGPRINQWLNGTAGPPVILPRTDFVSTTVNTDQDIFSFGCAILFINFLVYQLGHPLEDVIRAGGATLAETFARVTGQPASAAFATFNDLLQAHIGSSTTNNMLRDNIFPLRDVPGRSVEITLGDPVDKGHMTDATPVPWEVKPGILCSAAPYDFYRQRQLLEQPVFARARGMANAAFRWMIEGQEVAVRGVWTNVTVDRPLTVKNPDGTVTDVANTVTLQYGIRDIWNGSVLYLKTLNWNGNCDLTVTAAAKEAAINEAEVKADESVSLWTVTWSSSDAFQQASKRCNPYFENVNTSFWYLTARLSDLKNRPDPPSEGAVLEVVRAVEQVQKAVAQYAKAGHQPQAAVWRQLGTPGGLRSTDPVPPAPDLSRLRLQGARQGQGPPDAGGEESQPEA
jgi:hypothetical protein